jgi:hypothetical protein
MGIKGLRLVTMQLPENSPIGLADQPNFALTEFSDLCEAPVLYDRTLLMYSVQSTG